MWDLRALGSGGEYGTHKTVKARCPTVGGCVPRERAGKRGGARRVMRRGNFLKKIKDSYLKTKAKIWP